MMDRKTIDYYNSNTEAFVADTRNSNLISIEDRFLSYLPDGSRILDLGCGAGRDSKYFLSKGYDVEAVDGSEELCMSTSEMLGIEVRHLYFEELDYIEDFDGIWACASLLHVPSVELPAILSKCFKALKKDGIFYLSFKRGDFEGERDGRFFTDMTEDRLQKILSSLPERNTIEEVFITEDSRPGRTLQWVNIITRKM